MDKTMHYVYLCLNYVGKIRIILSILTLYNNTLFSFFCGCRGELFHFQTLECEALSLLFLISRLYVNLSSVLHSFERYLAICRPFRFKMIKKGPSQMAKVCSFYIIVCKVLLEHVNSLIRKII